MVRKRQVTAEQIENMSDEQLKLIEEKVGGKLRSIIDAAVNESNEILNIYGLQVKMQFLIEAITNPNKEE